MHTSKGDPFKMTHTRNINDLLSSSKFCSSKCSHFNVLCPQSYILTSFASSITKQDNTFKNSSFVD